MMPRAVVAALALATLFSVAHSEYIVRTVPLALGSAPVDVEYNRQTDRFYVACRGLPRLAVLKAADAAIDTVVDLTYPSHFDGMWLDTIRQRLYVLQVGYAESRLVVLDCRTNAIVRNIPTTHYAYSVSGSPTTGLVYLSSTAPTGLWVYDPAVETIVGQIPAPPYAEKLLCSPVVNKLYAAYPSSGWGFVVVCNCSTAMPVTRIDSVSTIDWYVSPYTSKLYIAAGYIYVVDPVTDSLTDTLAIHGIWDHFVHNPVDDLVFAYASYPGHVLVMDPYTDTVVRSLYLPTHGQFGSKLAYDPAFNRVLVIEHAGSYVYCLNGDGTAIVDAVRLPRTPVDIACSAAGIFCTANSSSDNVSVAFPQVGVCEPQLNAATRTGGHTMWLSTGRCFRLEEPAELRDAAGRLVRRLPAGETSVGGIASGVYVLTPATGGAARRRCVVVRE
jgi:hypothetical protein